MSLFSQLLGVTAIFIFIAAILYVIFGQVTVRKLRKNPETKNALGIEFVSGWDILNVAGALSLPRSLTRKFRESRLAVFAADAELLNKHTNRFDKFLAKTFYILYVFSGTTVIILLLLNALGVFE